MRPFEAKAAIQDVMWERLGPVRDGLGIETAITAFERIEREQMTGMVIGCKDRVYNRDRMEAIEVPLMVKTALLVARAAFERKESRGSHYRTDFPERNDRRLAQEYCDQERRRRQAGYKHREYRSGRMRCA